MSSPKGILAFDLDGTLVDSVPGIVATVNHVLADFNHQTVDDATIAAMIGLPLDNFWRDLAHIESQHWAAYTLRYREIYRNNAIPTMEAFIPVRETLTQLRSEGWHLSIASSKVVPVIQLVLYQIDMIDLFELLMGNDVVKTPKPDAEMLQRTWEFFKLRAAQTIMIGDTTHDVHMAHNAGVRSIAVTTGSHSEEALIAANPTALIHSLHALPVVLDELF